MTDAEMTKAVELARETGDLPMLDFHEGDVLDARDADDAERYEMAVINMRTTILAMHAKFTKQALVVEAARALSAAMYVGEEGWGLWCSTRNGPADHAALMIALRDAIQSPCETCTGTGEVIAGLSLADFRTLIKETP